MKLPQLFRTLRAQGWTEQPSKRHIKYRSPEGRLLVVSRSPSDQRAVANIIADARRLGADL